VIDAPGATPSQLVLALGKDRNAYLINRNNLRCITLRSLRRIWFQAPRTEERQLSHTYQPGNLFWRFTDDGNAISAYKSPQQTAHDRVRLECRSERPGLPWVTTTDGTNNVIVWVAGVAGDQRLPWVQWRYRRRDYAAAAPRMMSGTASGIPPWSLAVEFTLVPKQSVCLSAARRNTYAYTYRLLLLPPPLQHLTATATFTLRQPNRQQQPYQPDANTIIDFYSDSCTWRN